MKNQNIIAAIIVFFFITLPFSLFAQQWVRVNSPTTDDILNVKFYSENEGLVLTKNSLYKTTDGCKSWNNVRNKTDNEFFELFSAGSETMYVSSLKGNLIKSLDRGHNWIDIGIAGEGIDEVSAMYFVNDSLGYVFGNSCPKGFYWDSSFIFKTTNGGIKWTRLNVNLPFIETLCFINENIGWAGGTPIFDPDEYLSATSDGGKTWVRQERSQCLQGDYRKILFVNDQDGYAIGFSGNCIRNTTDGGTTWKDIYYQKTGIMSTGYCADIVVRSSKILICKNDNIYRSINNGELFTMDSIRDKPNINRFSLIKSLSANFDLFEYAAGRGGTIWKYNSQTINVRIEKMIPKNTILFQNYPNPFNPETKISFDIPETGLVQIKVFSITGQEINSLVDDTKPAGSYSVLWDGKDKNNLKLSSGVYFYQLIFANNNHQGTIVKKMIFMK